MTSFNGVIEAATRNANSHGDLTLGAQQVIAKRVALGIGAAIDPLRTDHAEFGRMMPEKIQAFSAAGFIMMQQAGNAGQQIASFASDAVVTAANATFAIAGSANPVAMIETQRRFAMAWFEKAVSNFIAMGALALGAQEAAMVPIQQTVADNMARLGQ